MTSKLAYVGLALVVLGGAFLLTPSFGFETIASDRAADVGTASDENATVGFEPTGEDLDGRNDSATLFWLRNNAPQELSFVNTIYLSIAELAVLDDGEGTVAPGDATAVSVDCGTFSDTDSASLTATIDTASGQTVTITGASSVTSFLADCDSPRIVWETDADWNAGTGNRTVSDAVGDREADTVRLGYPTDSNGLVAYWPLDEDTGSTVLDATGPNDGNASGGYVLDRRGVLNSSGFRSDGTGQINVSDDPSLRLQGDMAVSVWVKTNSLGSSDDENNQVYFLQKSNYQSDGYILLDNGDYTSEVIFRVNGAGSNYDIAFDRSKLNDGTWHNVVGVRNGTDLELYLDGELQASRSDSELDTNTTIFSLSGGRGGDGNLDGDLEEVSVYNSSLSPSEVESLHQTTVNGTRTTDWKSTADPLQADELALKNVSARLGGTDATVSVESDTDDDGVADETSDPISLADGTSGYDVTGIATDSDRFRLALDLSTTNVSRTPIVSAIELSEDRSNFSVTVDATNEPVVEGETLTVDATVENVGTDPATQTIELRDFGGAVVDSREVTLEAGAATSLSLNWSTTDGDAGTGDVNVTSEDDHDTSTVTVEDDDDYFAVSVDATNSPVVEGENLTVDATIANTGNSEGTQTIELREFDGTVADTTDVTLASGASTAVELTWQTQIGDNGTGTVTVASENETASTSVTVEELQRLQASDVDPDVSLTQKQYVVWTPDGDYSDTYGFQFGDPHPDVNYDNVTLSDITLEASPAPDMFYEWRTPEGGYSEHILEFDPTNVAADETINFSITNWTSPSTGGPWNVSLKNMKSDAHWGNTTFNVTGGGQFNVSIDGTNSPVVEGENLTVDATITNNGNYSDTQTVELTDFDGAVVDRQEVALDDGNSTAISLNWSTQVGDNGTGTVAVSSEDETNSTSVTIEQQAYFDVTIDGTTAPVLEGTNLTVDATIENTGDDTDTQTVELTDFDGAVADSTSVSLSSGANVTVSLNWSTQVGDAGTGNVTVVSENDANATEVTVTRDGARWLTDDDWSVGATPNRTVSDAVGDRENDTVRLGYNATESGLVSYWPFDEDSGTTAVDAAGANDGDHRNGVGVGATGKLNTTAYNLTGTDTYVRVPHDSSLEFSEENAVAVSTWVKPQNLTGRSRTPLVQKSDKSYNLQLKSDEPSFTIYNGTDWHYAQWNQPLANDTWYHLVGTYDGSNTRLYVNGSLVDTASVSTLDDSNQTDLAIGENVDDKRHRRFDGTMEELRIYGRNLTESEATDLYATTEAGDHTTDWQVVDGTLTAQALTLQNVTATLGGENATLYLESDTDGDGVAEETSDPIPLQRGTSQYEVSGLATDTDTLRLRAEFDTANRSRTPIVSRVDVVQDDSNVTVAIDGTNEPVVEGETLTVDVTAENVGNDSGTRTIELEDFDGAVVDRQEVTLAAGENASLTLNWSTQVGDNGTDAVSVTSGDDRANQTVTIEQQAHFAVAIDGTNSPVVEGENLTVDATIENTGGATDEQTVELTDFDGAVVDSTSVSLSSGANVTVSLNWSTRVGDNGTGTVAVSSEDETNSTEATVQADGEFFDVTIDGTNAPIVEGETLTANATIDNVGTDSGTQTVELRNFTDAVVDSATVSLASGENASVSLNWSTVEGDAATDNVTVASENDTAAREVTVERAVVFGPVWETDADWSAGSFVRTVSDDAGDRANDTVRLGYDAGEGGLVSYWTFDEDSGSTAVDAAGGNDGSVEGGTAVGRLGLLDGTSYYFDQATGDHVNVSADPSLELSAEDNVTLSTWVEADTANTGNSPEYLIEKGSGYRLWLDGRTPTFGVYANGGWQEVTASSNLQLDEWTHLAGSYDGSAATIYVDGEPAGTTSVSASMDDSSGTKLEVLGTADSWQGRLDEIRVYNESRTDAEIADLVQTTRDGRHVTDWRANDTLTVGNLYLQNVSAPLDAADNATIYVESDTDGDGAVDETSDQVELANDTTSYAVSGLSTDNDRFRLRVELATSNQTTTPIVSKVELGEDTGPYFDVSISSMDHTVLEGDTVRVPATVENLGDASDTQTIELTDFDGSVVDSQSVSLDPGQSASIELAWDTSVGTNGTGSVTVRSENNTHTDEVTLQSFVKVDSCGTLSSGGEIYGLVQDLTHSATGACLAVGSGAHDLTIDGRGHQIDMTGGGDYGLLNDYNADGTTVRRIATVGGVRGVDFRDADDTVVENARFEGATKGIRIQDGNTVNWTVRNVTARDNAQGIYVGGSMTGIEIRDSTIVSNDQYGVDIYNNDPEVTVYDSRVADNGDGDLKARGGSTLRAIRVNVGDSTAANTTVNATVTQVTVKGVGNAPESPDGEIPLDRYLKAVVDDDEQSGPALDLDLYYEQPDVDGLNVSELDLWRNNGTWGELASTVDANDRVINATDVLSISSKGDSETFAGLAPPKSDYFAVQDLKTEDIEPVNQSVPINATVQNVGVESGTQTIEYRFGGEVKDSQTVTLAVDETAQVSFNYTPTETGVYEHGIHSGNDSATATIDVGELSDGPLWWSRYDWDVGLGQRAIADLFGDRSPDSVSLGYNDSEANLVSYWHLDEDSGGWAEDAVGGNDGDIEGSPTLGEPGLLNSTSFDFSGTQPVVVPDDESIEMNETDAVSVSLWFNGADWSNSKAETLLLKDQQYRVQIVGGDPVFSVYVDDGTGGAWVDVTSSTAATKGKWHHLTGTYDGTTVELYLDGTSVGSATTLGTMVDSSGNDLQFVSSTAKWVGRLDEIRLYDAGLSSSKVGELHDTGSNGTYTTDWRTNATTMNVSTLQLTNASLEEGPGANATAYVESDTNGDGAVDETSDQIDVVAGTTTYDVTGLSTDTDRFRVRVELDTTNRTVTPVVKQVELQD